jgi:prepilin-type N-terminal cleavage/methylation domain-containing protein
MSTTFSSKLSVARGQWPVPNPLQGRSPQVTRRGEVRVPRGCLGQNEVSPQPRTAYRAFTLVELLVVIGIIGILTSLASVAMFRGLTAAKQARTAAEVTQLAGGMEQFKLKFGDYPPSYLNHKDPVSFAMMKRFLAKAFPRCNPDVEIWYIPWCDSTNSYYPYLDQTNTLNVWDPAGGSPSGALPMSPAQALVFWLSSISKDPAHPLSAPTDDRISFFDFDNGRISRLNTTVSQSNSVSGSGWTVLTGSFSPPTWSQGPTAATAGKYPKYNVGTYAPRDGSQQAYVYFEARCYLLHAMFLSANPFPPAATSSNPPPLNNPPVPYLSQSAPWDNNLPPNGYLDAGFRTNPTDFDVPTDNLKNITPQSFTVFQSLCVNPKSFQIISAGADNDFGLVNTSSTAGGAPITQTQVRYYGPDGVTPTSYNIYYKSYPDGQGYDNISNGDDDNITNFSESPLGNAKSR